ARAADHEVVGGRRGDDDGGAAAGDRARRSVDGRDRLGTGGAERGAEAPHPVGQWAVGRRSGGGGGGGEVRRGGVALGRVVERILRHHREAEGDAGRRRARDAENEVIGGGGADGDRGAGAGDRAGDRVGGGDRLAAGGPERGAEAPHPVGQWAVDR